MKVWLLHIGEELPVDGPERPFRYGYLARALEQNGHQVLRWSPTFRHTAKKQRFHRDTRVDVTRKYSIQFVYAPGYQRNIGVQRLRTYRVLGRRFPTLAVHQEKPDVIVAAIPSLEWAEAAVEYGRTNGIPVVVDIRDLWPDIFPSALPAVLRPAGRVLLMPYRRAAIRACRGAAAICAVSQSYLDWGLRMAGRTAGPRDVVFSIGYEPDHISAPQLRAEVTKLCDRGIDLKTPICYFAGALERHHDVETIIGAARLLQKEGRNHAQFVICGSGSKTQMLQQMASGIPSIHFLGWVGASTLQAVASISVIGLCAYADGTLVSLGNKPFEYMAGGLAIASSLPGDLAALISQHDCGVTYQAGSAKSLATCLLNLLNESGRLDSMRRNAFTAWQTHYRSRDIYQRFVDHLATLTPDVAAAA